MVNWRRPIALGSFFLMLAASTLLAQGKEPQPRKLSSDENKELNSISTMLNSNATASQNDLSLTWIGNDLLKAQGNKEYVPFTVTIDPSKATAGKVAFYWRVVAKDAPAADVKKDDKDKKGGSQQYIYQNLHTIEVPKGATAPVRISRSVVVSAGSYDLVIVAKEPDPKKKSDPPAKMSVLHEALTVPELWNSELNTSSVIVAERIDPLPAPLTTAQQEERPYALGNMEIVPATATKFSKKNELSVFLLIYNAKVDASNGPDVTVEYNFYNVQNGSEKFFNKTNPQSLNAQTLPAGFDPAAGITNGQTVPLASFPEGDYRLEIKITDKQANKTITRDVKFSVAAS
jgi:hypothetical protein